MQTKKEIKKESSSGALSSCLDPPGCAELKQSYGFTWVYLNERQCVSHWKAHLKRLWYLWGFSAICWSGVVCCSSGPSAYFMSIISLDPSRVSGKLGMAAAAQSRWAGLVVICMLVPQIHQNGYEAWISPSSGKFEKKVLSVSGYDSAPQCGEQAEVHRWNVQPSSLSLPWESKEKWKFRVALTGNSDSTPPSIYLTDEKTGRDLKLRVQVQMVELWVY